VGFAVCLSLANQSYLAMLCPTLGIMPERLPGAVFFYPVLDLQVGSMVGSGSAANKKGFRDLF